MGLCCRYVSGLACKLAQTHENFDKLFSLVRLLGVHVFKRSEKLIYYTKN